MSDGGLRLDAGGRVLAGMGIGSAMAAGTVLRMGDPIPEPAPAPAAGTDPEAELALVRTAIADVAAELRRRADAAIAAHPGSGSGDPAGTEAADVLEAQAMIAEDPALATEIEGAIAGGQSGARAAYDAFGRYRDMLAAAGPYLAARVADLDDVRQRVVAACLGVPVPGVPDPGHPYVLVARDLSPADTALLDTSVVIAIVTEEGGPTSHTAVLARALGIPAVVGCPGARELTDGERVVVAPGHSAVIADPAPEQVEAATRSAASWPAGTGPAENAGGSRPGRTADGHAVALLANVGGPADVPAALAAGAEGVGLYRTEVLFLGTDRAPSRGEQTHAYRQVLSAFGPGTHVVIRVLDAGADKPLPYLTPDGEPNPALGIRGLRALRANPIVLEDQLAAIAAAVHDAGPGRADVWVMAPMVAEPAEAAWFAQRCAHHGLAVAGVMIEVPSAALLAAEILAETEFVSIGTNDLAQYALAVDRQASGLGALQDPWHPGLLRLVAMTGAAGATAGKPVGVCGEAAADPLLACVLVGLGVTSLSMAAPAIAAVRASLASVTLAECQALAVRVIATGSAAQARAAAIAAFSS